MISYEEFHNYLEYRKVMIARYEDGLIYGIEGHELYYIYASSERRYSSGYSPRGLYDYYTQYPGLFIYGDCRSKRYDNIR